MSQAPPISQTAAPPSSAPRLVVLMGVAGSGKSTVGRLLATQLGWQFLDSDAYHPEENRQKMSAGLPLNDGDRRPWLERLRRVLDAHLQCETGAVVACSALKRSYRRILGTERPAIALVHLAGTPELLAQRLATRRNHFFPPDLLDSQLQTLETPSGAVHLSIEQAPDALCQCIIRQCWPNPSPPNGVPPTC